MAKRTEIGFLRSGKSFRRRATRRRRFKVLSSAYKRTFVANAMAHWEAGCYTGELSFTSRKQARRFYGRSQRLRELHASRVEFRLEFPETESTLTRAD